MPYTINWNDAGSEIVYTGKVSSAEIREVDDAHYGDERFDLISYQLSDFSAADTSEITLEDSEVCAAHDAVGTNYNPRLKVAIVASYSAKELFDEYVRVSKEHHSSWEFEFFDNYTDAKKWCAE